MLRNILRFGRNESDRRTGYCHVADGKAEPMNDAYVGQIISVEGHGPPWIVVDEAPTTAILAKWPGKLWKVSIIKAAAEKDQPMAYARYTRALSVEVIAEENPAHLFGEHGAGVLTVLNEAARLDYETAQILSSARHPDAPAAYDRVFRRWANAEGLEVGYDGNLDGTLRIGSKPHGSPIYNGLTVLHSVVFERAKALGGESATTVQDEEEYLNLPWDVAGAVLGDAALALGAPDFASDEDQTILLNGWTNNGG